MEPTTKKGLHLKSKLIQKSVTVSSKAKEDVSIKKYKTHKEAKPKIQRDLLKEVVQYLHNNTVGSSYQELLATDLNELIAQVPKDIYNRMLSKVLSRHDPTFVNDVKTLTSWRKKIKSWNQSTEKPETRGHPVVPPHKLEIFRVKAFEVLEALPFRSFPLLQERFLVILEEFHIEEQNGFDYKPFDPKTCSKHWWHDFMKKNLDLKEAWENIPLERTVKAGKASPRTSNSPNSLSAGREMSQQSEDERYTNFTETLSSPVIDYEQPRLLSEEFFERLERIAETERVEKMLEEIMMDPTEAMLISDDTMNAFDDMI